MYHYQVRVWNWSRHVRKINQLEVSLKTVSKVKPVPATLLQQNKTEIWPGNNVLLGGPLDDWVVTTEPGCTDPTSAWLVDELSHHEEAPINVLVHSLLKPRDWTGPLLVPPAPPPLWTTARLPAHFYQVGSARRNSESQQDYYQPRNITTGF